MACLDQLQTHSALIAADLSEWLVVGSCLFFEEFLGERKNRVCISTIWMFIT